MMSLPNLLTLARIAVLPVICLLMYAHIPVFAVVLYIICALTDFFDGYLARKLNAVSDFGTFLDPIADKIFVAVILLVLVDIGTVAGYWIIPVIVILVREFLVSGMREFLGPKNVKLPVSQLAKWKTTLQMAALVLLIAAPLMPVLGVAGLWSLLIAAVLTAITGWSYLQEGFKYMR